MKKPRVWHLGALFTALVVTSWWGFTSQTIGTRITAVFPGSKPQVQRLNSDDIFYDDFVRLVVPTFFRKNEQMGLELVDAKEPLDLAKRFSRLRGIHFTGVRFTRCKITSLPETAKGLMIFEDCDFSELPEEQRNWLRPYDQSNPFYAKTLAYGTI